MSLNEQVLEDVQSLFMDTDELATVHQLDGQPIKLIADSDRLERWKEINLPSSIAVKGHNLADAEVFLFVPSADFPEPSVGQVINYDGRSLRVASAEVVDGMLEMVLGGSV